MMIVFFYIQGVVMAQWDPPGQTVSHYNTIEIVTKFHEEEGRKRPGLWRKLWILHQDDAPSHNALSVKQFLSSKNITVLAHLPYWPNSDPCDLFFFQRSNPFSKDPFCVGRRNESKNDATPEQSLQKVICVIVSNSGSISRSCVLTQNETALREITNDFLNKVNK
jgi:hypothetical protein